MAKLGWRHVQVLTIFFCIGSAITMRVCLSVAVVVMTGKDTDGDGFQRFDWAPTETSAVLGAFLWGYMCTQVAGGALAAHGHANINMALSLATSGLITAALPFAASAGSWGAVTALRILTGIIQGVIYPSWYALMSRWVPPEERSRAGNLILAAQPLGNILASALSGWISVVLGWPAIFYAFGLTGVAMAGLLFLLTADSPATHSRISKAEVEYITKAIASSKHHAKMAVPWRALLTSGALWSLIAAHVGYLWGYWVIITCLPAYLENVLEVGIELNGLVSSMPYISMMIFSIFFGWLGDLIEVKGWLSTSKNRKLLNTIGEAGPGVVCVLLAVFGADHPTLAVALLVLCGGLISSVFSGALLSFVDIAPNFSGITFGVGNMVGSFVSAFAPYAQGLFVDPSDPMPGWGDVFYLTAAVYFIFNLIYCVFGTAKVQSWNYGTEMKDSPKV